MNVELKDVTSRALFSCLRITTGLPVRKTGDGAEIQIDGTWCFCQADFESIYESDDGVKAYAYVKLALTKQNIIEDYIVSVGDTVGEAALAAIQQFVSGVVMPIAAISGKMPPHHSNHVEHATISKMLYAGTNWTVSIGQVTSNDTTGKLYDVVDDYPPVDIVWGELARKMTNQEPHWAKLFLCRYPDGALDCEVRIDNELDQQAMHTLRAFVWPTEQPLIWFRQFCYVEPVGYREANAPVRNINMFKWSNPFAR